LSATTCLTCVSQRPVVTHGSQSTTFMKAVAAP